MDLVKQQLEQIIEWLPLLDDVTDSLLTAPPQGMSLSGVHGSSAQSRTERVVSQLRAIRNIHVDLTNLASDWDWRGPQLDGSPQHWLLARLPWMRKNRAPDEYEPQIKDIHARLAKHTKQNDHRTGRLCPGCGAEELREHGTEYYACNTCNIVRSQAEVDGLTEAKLLTSNAMLPVNQAAKILNLSRHTINSWIRRGKLTVGQGRRVSVKDIHRLLRRNG